jgi:hypothetical protein
MDIWRTFAKELRATAEGASRFVQNHKDAWRKESQNGISTG